MMLDTALITGASGGIGLEFARIFARHGHDLVLVARNEAALNRLANELRQQHNINVVVIPQDLAEPGAPQILFDQTEGREIPIEYLVNNAGFASYGFFHTLDIEHEVEMINLNVVTLTRLTHLFLNPMIERGSGGVLNVASTAAFQPGPLMATYYATKAYVLSFSEAIANEVSDRGVTVSALCPGPTETGFQSRAEMEESRLVQDGLMGAAEVARVGYNGLMAGKRVVVPGAFNYLGAVTTRFLPRDVSTSLVRRMQERSDHRSDP